MRIVIENRNIRRSASVCRGRHAHEQSLVTIHTSLARERLLSEEFDAEAALARRWPARRASPTGFSIKQF